MPVERNDKKQRRLHPSERKFLCGEEARPVSILTDTPPPPLSLTFLLSTFTAPSQTLLFYLSPTHPSLFTVHTPPFVFWFLILFLAFNISLFCYTSSSISCWCFLRRTPSSAAWTVLSPVSRQLNCSAVNIKVTSPPLLNTSRLPVILDLMTVWIIHLAPDLPAFCTERLFSYLTAVCSSLAAAFTHLQQCRKWECEAGPAAHSEGVEVWGEKKQPVGGFVQVWSQRCWGLIYKDTSRKKELKSCLNSFGLLVFRCLEPEFLLSSTSNQLLVAHAGPRVATQRPVGVCETFEPVFETDLLLENVVKDTLEISIWPSCFIGANGGGGGGGGG